MRPNGTSEELERRRRRSIDLWREGKGPTEIAALLDADRRTVQRWIRRFEKGGDSALDSIPHPGPEPKLTLDQRAQLSRELLKGAKSLGFTTDLWTGPRVARVIQRKFGVRYHLNHMGRFLRSIGWTPQKPQKKPYQRDDQMIQEWIRKDWPKIKKSAAS